MFARARWGLAFGLLVGLTDLIPASSTEAVSSGHFLPAGLLIGAALGSAFVEKTKWWIIIPAAIVGAVAAMMLPGWEAAQQPEWHRYFMGSAGLTIALIGALLAGFGWQTGARTAVTGVAAAITGSLVHPDPSLFLMLPMWAATYVPLLVWYPADWWVRGAGFVGNVTTIALIQNAAPAWLLGSSFAPFALAIVYATVMVFLHMFRTLEARRLRHVAIWCVVFFATATFVAATDGLAFMTWVPTAGLLPALAALGAYHAGADGRRRQTARWTSFGIGALCALLGLTTAIGRLRDGEAIWESLPLLGFGLAWMAGWWWLTRGEVTVPDPVMPRLPSP